MDISIPEDAKQGWARLLWFLLRSLIACQYRTVGGRVLFVLILLVVTGVLAFRHPHGPVVHILRLPVLAAAVFLVAVLEEFGHAAAMIQKGLAQNVRALRVSHLMVGARTELFVEAFGIHIQGQMTHRDVLQVTAAGPLFSLSGGSVLLLASWLSGGRPAASGWTYACLSSLLVLWPLSSLTPMAAVPSFVPFSPDGERILRIKREHRLGARTVLREMAQGLGLVWSFMIHGQRG